MMPETAPVERADILAPADRAKYVAARSAVLELRDGMLLGLGTGSTAEWFVHCLAEWAHVTGGSVTCVPTSEATARLARHYGLRLATLDELGTLDVTIDGADEFDPALTLVKGGGAAHLREKIVAAGSERLAIISDATKEVAELGKFPLPVEVVRFGHTATREHIVRVLKMLGQDSAAVALRVFDGAPVVTDEGNHIYDIYTGHMGDAAALAAALSDIPGVVEHGLFIGMAACVYLGHAEGHAEALTPEARAVVTFDDGLSEEAILARRARTKTELG